MKYDLNNKSNRFAQRTLEAFSSVMMELLEKKPFEQITVNELCQACNYPRATFYNYFDDSYDLLNYCWIAMMTDMEISQHIDPKSDDCTYVLFGLIYDYFDQWRDRLGKIMAANPLDGAMVTSCNLFLKQQISQIFLEVLGQEAFDIPYQLVAEHYANTIQLVIEWSFLRKQLKSKEEAESALRQLLQ